MRGGEDRQIGRGPGDDEADAETKAADEQRQGHADPIGHAPEAKRSEGEAEHGQGVGGGGGRAVDGEFELHLRQHDNHRPHARARERSNQQRQGEARVSIGAIRRVTIRIHEATTV